MFKLKSSSKNSPFDTIHLLRYFFHCSKQFLNSFIFIPFSASAIFCFTTSTLAKWFPLKTSFIQGNKKSHWGWDWMNRSEGNWCHAVFGQKLLNTQSGVGRWAHKSPEMGKCLESSKKIHWGCYNASWYTDADGFLEHSPGGGSLLYKGPALQKIILVWGGSPSYIELPQLNNKNNLIQKCAKD